MKCPQCQKAELKESIENHLYEESGLSNVTLRGIKKRRCPNCGNVLVSIPGVSDLHKVLAAHLVLKPYRLEPTEIRFLRKFMGLSSSDLANRLHVNPEQVSRWESAKSPQAMGKTAETALRLLAVLGLKGKLIKNYANELAQLSLESPSGTNPVYLGRENDQWEAEAA